MSIKEALTRDTRSFQQKNPLEWYEWSKSLRRERYEYSFLSLEKSGSLELLRELAHIIRVEFSDVALMRINHPTTWEVNLALEWNYGERDFPSRLRYCKRLSINADPLSRFISVHSGNLLTVLSEPEWSSSQEHLENAIVYAYRQPAMGFSALDLTKNAKTISIDPV